MSGTNRRIDGERLWDSLMRMAEIGATPRGGVRRLALSAEDARGRDTLRVELLVEDAAATDTRLGLVERGEAAAARQLARPYFVQMKGRLRVSGRAGGAPVAGEGAGFFETYR